MVRFVVLAGFTDQGIRNVKETIGRAEAFKEMAKKSGITVKGFIGRSANTMSLRFARHRTTSATALSLSVCSRGNVRSETLRAFSFEVMKKILGQYGLRRACIRRSVISVPSACSEMGGDGGDPHVEVAQESSSSD